MDVIILNGPSSSGKSSIAKELQTLLPDHYLHIGIDTFIAMMPEHSNCLSLADEPADGFYWQTQSLGNGSTLRVRSGRYGVKINKAYHSTIKHLADSGLKVIVDDVMDGGKEQKLWLSVLHGLNAIFVAVTCCDLDLLSRERHRCDRIDGSALEQNNRVHQGVKYDFKVSTTNDSARECAQQIVSYITTL